MTGILLLLQRCSKYCISAPVEVPVKFGIENLDEVAFVEMEFYDGSRPIRADILYPPSFINNIYEYTYEFDEVMSDTITIVRTIYAHDRSWVEYIDKRRITYY